MILFVVYLIGFGILGMVTRKLIKKLSIYGFWAKFFANIYALGVRIHEVLHYFAIFACGLGTRETQIVIKRDGTGGYVVPHFRHEPSFFQALLIASAPLVGGTVLVMEISHQFIAFEAENLVPWYLTTAYWIMIVAIFMVINPSEKDWAIVRNVICARIGNSLRQAGEMVGALYLLLGYWEEFQAYLQLPDPWFELVVYLGLFGGFESLWLLLRTLVNRPLKAPYSVKPSPVIVAPHDPILANFQPKPSYLGPNDRPSTEEDDVAVADQLIGKIFSQEDP